MSAWALVSRQMRYRPMGMYGGIPCGFDFAAVKAILVLYGLWDEEVVDGLLIIEEELERFYVREFEESIRTR